MQAAHRMAHRLEHALHLMLAAFVDRQLEARWPDPLDGRGRRRPVFELDARRELLEYPVARLSLHVHFVDLVHLVAGVHETMGERPIVREQERTRRVRI